MAVFQWNISIVYSHLNYGIHAWGSACSTNLNKLVVLQKKAVRILSGVQYFQIYGQPQGPLPASNPLFKNLEILKLEDIYKLNIAIFIFSSLNKDNPSIFHDWFTYTYNHLIYAHNTRVSANFENYGGGDKIFPSGEGIYADFWWGGAQFYQFNG